MDWTPHVLLAGDEAVEFAAGTGVETGRDLTTAETRQRYERADPPDGGPADHLDWVREHFSGTDTVGAVATDGDRLAAATSTAGRWLALAGRVGDVPQVGAGFYADGRGGASATGEGEAIARFGVARRAVELLDTSVRNWPPKKPSPSSRTRPVDVPASSSRPCRPYRGRTEHRRNADRDEIAEGNRFARHRLTGG